MAKTFDDKGVAETPLMKQYNQIKARHPEALLLFRVGDFYETFREDAIKTSKILGIILTKRKNGTAAEIELASLIILWIRICQNWCVLVSGWRFVTNWKIQK